MRIIARLIIGVALVLALTAVGLYLLRKPIAEAAVEQVMRDARLEAPSVDVDTVGFRRLSLLTMKAGAGEPPPLDLRNVVFTYDLLDLIFRGRLISAEIGEGSATLAVAEDGGVSLAGWRPDPDAPSKGAPLKSIAIKALALTVLTPKGPAEMRIAGDIDLQSGGALEFSGKAGEAGIAAGSISNGAVEGSLTFGADDALALDASLKGDLVLPAGVARGVDLAVAGTLSGWKSFLGSGDRALAGKLKVALRQSTVASDVAPSLKGALSRGGGDEIKTLAISGAAEVSFDREGFSVSLKDDPLTIAADRGDALVITASDGPLYEERNGARRLSLRADLEGPVASGRAAMTAAAPQGAPWTISAEARFGEQRVATVRFKDFSGRFSGSLADGVLSGVVNADAHVNEAAVGRLTISDMPVKGALDLNYVVADARATVTPAGASCIDIGHASFKFAEQDMDANVKTATLCASATPLFTFDFGAAPLTHSDGSLTARTARYRLGATLFEGAPPAINYSLDYRPDAQTSAIKGEMKGGNVILNNFLRLTQIAGTFGMDLVGETMSADAALDRVRIAETAKLENFAPVDAAGKLVLADDVASFDFLVSTPNGVALGRGEGWHGVASGRGEALFDSGILSLSPRLQPDRIFPKLRGVIGAATGKVESRVRFLWDQKGYSSSATVNLDTVSFHGPGVAVTRTEGVSGKLVFKNLSPVTTGFAQSLSIARIDMDALKLDNGEVVFSAPGDDTLKIVEAEFPWFNGTIGVYNSTMSLTGKSQTTMQIDNVDLKSILEFINVDGLSGEGTIEGVLPITFEGGKARVDEGIVSSKGPGVIRYEGKATDAAAASNSQSALAFDVLRQLRFEKLSATLDGPLDGTVNFNILFEGRSDIPVKTGNKTQRVDSPVKYRITINAPLLSLIEQAMLSTNVREQIDRAREQDARTPKE